MKPSELAAVLEKLQALLQIEDCEADPNEPPDCVRCGSSMHVPNGFDPTPECDSCAQQLLAAARELLATIEREGGE